MNRGYTDEYVGEVTASVDVIRLTPLLDGIPQHHDASVWSFHDRVTLSFMRRLRTPDYASSGSLGDQTFLAGITAGLITHQHFLCEEAITYIDGLLDRHSSSGMAVETWSDATLQDSLWGYALLPHFARLPSPADDWPVKEPEDTTVRTAGHVRPNPLYTWPDPHPHPARIPPPDEHAYVLYAVTSTRPPRSPYGL